MASIFSAVRDGIREERLIGLATVVSGDGMGAKAVLGADGSVEGDLGLSGALEERVLARCRKLLEGQETTSFSEESDATDVEIFFESFAPPPKLVIVGAVHVAIPLVSLAKTLGFCTVVVDARSVYATEQRFPHCDELIVRWPADALAEMHLHEATYCVFLTHDLKLDNPALVVALRSHARYIGALGSKKTHAKRVEALQEEGLSAEEIARIHAPIGIKLGGSRPEEIAISIAAEMVAARYGRA